MVDPTHCDREPIHIPGTIQAYGIVLVLTEPGLDVAQISDNVSDHFSLGAQEILGCPLATLLDEPSVDRVRTTLHDELRELNPLPIHGWGGQRFDGIVHRQDGATILELEPALVDPSPEVPRHHPFRSALLQIQRANTLRDLADIVVHQMRRVTGFERVMFYRFHEDGSGSVDAEAKDEPLESYLGLRYPASDIPAQVRQLYLKNWLRLIVDARRPPAHLVPVLRPDTGRPLDLSFAVLRGVSPVHLEYMANMGVRASMSISIIVRGRLWGLISCLHHTGPHRVSYEIRSACEFLGRLISLQIDAFDDRETLALRASRRATEIALDEAMRNSAVDEDALAVLLTRPEELMQLVGADGVALVGPHELVTCGRAPSRELIQELATWLETRGDLRPFSTASLGELFPPALEASDVASGLLTFALPGTPQKRLLWFRSEIIKTVNWGGDPSKSVESETGRLRPRNSFALWKQEVRNHAAPWTAGDLEAADDLQRRAIEIDIQRRLWGEQRAVRTRDDVIAIVSHDLRNPLATIFGVTQLLLNEARANGAHVKLERILRAAASMKALIEDLLDLSTIEAGRFSLHLEPVESRSMLEDALSATQTVAEVKQITVTKEWTDLPRLDADPNRISQVLSNLLGNAIKFTPKGGTVVLRTESRGGELMITVADTGPGIDASHLPHVFDRYWRAKPSSRQGAGLGLYIARGIVEAHGGRIWAESSERGARLSFTLPLSPEDRTDVALGTVEHA